MSTENHTSKIQNNDPWTELLYPRTGDDKLNDAGTVEVIFGPMFAGKSTELIRRVRRIKCTGSEVLCVKYSKDTRYTTNNEINTHDNDVKENSISCNGVLYEIKDVLTDPKYQCISIDEGQFFRDIVEASEILANHFGKHIIIAALNGTFERMEWNSNKLLSRADIVTHLTAICKNCNKNDAPFSFRTNQNIKNLEHIGGSDSYIAVCRKCFLLLNQSK